MLRIASLTALVVLGFTASAQAGAFTSSSAFFAATSGTTIENYGSTTAGQLVPQASTLDGLTYSFSTAAGLGGVITNLFNSFSGLSLAAKQTPGPLTNADFFQPGEDFTVSFPAPVTAAGVFANVNLNSGTYTLSTTAGSATTDSAAYDTSTFVFVGLTSSTPFSSATFVSNDVNLGSYNIPEIVYETAVPVPEIMSLAVLGVGLLGLGLARRRS